jgi:Right handed beta helix region
VTALLALLAAVATGAGGPAVAADPVPPGPDVTAWLQERLDAGGEIVLPQLANSGCYRSRGLWVTRSDTTVRSDGACIEAIAPGPVRFRGDDGDPIAARAVFYVSRPSAPGTAPHDVRISGLRLVVPRRARMFGLELTGTRVDVDDVTVSGAPIDAVLVGGRGDGPATDVSIHDSRFAAGTRNVVSITSARRVSVTRCTLAGATDTHYLAETRRPFGNPGAAIDVEPDRASDPIVDVRIADNRIWDNAGPGIVLALDPNKGRPREADRIAIEHNVVIGNGRRATPPLRGGIVVAGGQARTPGHVAIRGNVIRANRGYGLVGHPVFGTTMIVDARGNDLRGNTAGRWRFVRLGRGSHLG